MILELRNGAKFETILFLDGRDVFDLIGFDIKMQLFLLGLSKIDEEIISVAELSKEDKEGLYLWCLTYDIHRADGIIGMVLDYYLLELIIYLKTKYGIKGVKLCKAFPKSFKTILKRELKLKVINNAPLKKEIALYIRYKVGPLKSIVKKLNLSIKYKAKGIKELPNDTALILGKTKKSNTRLKGFPEELMKKHINVFILDINLSIVKNYATGEEYIVNPFKFSFFLKAFKDTLTFVKYKKKFLKKNKTEIGGYDTYLIQQSFIQTYSVKLKELAYTELFKQLKPTRLIVSSTFGDPQKRMPLIIANRQGINTTLFSCRPFITKMRSEDRVIKPDILQYHNSTIGNEIFVFDKPSYNHLKQSGVSKEKIKFYFPETKHAPNNKTNSYNDSILLLFASPYYNDELIKLFQNLKKAGLSFHRMLYREHPNLKITIKQLGLLKGVCSNLVCITSELWQNVKFTNVLAITSNSTSGIDALSRGASLLWLPFLTEQSLQFGEMMENLGFTVTNESDFNKFIISYLNSSNFTREVNEKCLIDFESKVKNDIDI
ncbi:hypothetical protein O4H26_13135 [Aequorivita viscosa]|nr:hypothetical protein [Aequorivita viscosa]